MAETTVFDKIPKDDWLYESSNYFVIRDGYPVSPSHLLIISKQVRKDFFHLTPEEREELPSIINTCKLLIEDGHSPDGYNIGMNCGKAAGQTVFHFHCHIIPRYKGDMDDPRGGVRHCVSGKGYYETSSES